MAKKVSIAALERMLNMISVPYRELAPDDQRAFLEVAAHVHGVTGTLVEFQPVWSQSTNTKVPAIKFVRSITGMGLKEAKEFVEANRWLPLTGQLTREHVEKEARDCDVRVRYNYHEEESDDAGAPSTADPRAGSW